MANILSEIKVQLQKKGIQWPNALKKSKRSAHFLLLFTVGIMLFCADSCTQKPKEDVGIPIEELLTGLDPEKLADLMLLKAADSSYKPNGIYDIRFNDTLKTFYLQRKGMPVWLPFLRDSMVRVHINETLFGTEIHGLQAKFYNGVLIDQYLQKFDSMKHVESDSDYNFLSDLDYLISMSVMSVYKDLALGRIDPYSFYKPFFELNLSRAKSFNLFSVLTHQRSFQDTISLKSPNSIHYHALQLLYKNYTEFVKKNTVLVYDTAQDNFAQHNQNVLNQRLEMIWGAQNDSAADLKMRIIADQELYIKKTRALFSLAPGKLDSVFMAQICVPPSEFIDNALASLERERWFSKPDTGHYVYVNLIDFVAELKNDSIAQMRVCVGKSKLETYDEKYRAYLKSKIARAKPINSETPVIASMIKEIVINPTWTVPNSIIGKEMYHQIINNPHYLTRKGFEVVDEGKVVSPTSINWKKFKPYGVTVKIRQKAGPNNSLGILKFNFPNGHNIYMHDTPEKGKFNQRNRAVSHGCVRLHDPEAMAEFLLRLQDDSTLVDNFRLKMGLQPYDTALQIEDSLLKPIKTTEIIRLKKTIPVYIDYRTIVFEQDATLRFANDIYRKNKSIAKRLNE